MRLDELPRTLLAEQLARLARAFPGRHPDLDGMAAELQTATRTWTSAEFIGAIDAVIRTERWFPRIASILRSRPTTPRHLALADDDEPRIPGACDRCGVLPYLAGYETQRGDVIGRYRCRCPQLAAGWSTPHALAWQETDPALLAAGWTPPPHNARFTP